MSSMAKLHFFFSIYLLVFDVIYVLCRWFSCFCPFSKVTVNVLDIISVRKLSPFKLLCLPHHLLNRDYLISEE